MKPFIKWAGGKDKEYSNFSTYIPKKINKYVEPFLGGGAVFFNLSDRSDIKKRYVNDFSSELIATYKLIKDKDNLFFNELDTINENIKLMNRYSEERFPIFYEFIVNKKENSELSIESLIENIIHFNKKSIKLVDLHINLANDFSLSIEDYNNLLYTYIKKATFSKIKTISKLFENGNDITVDNLKSIFQTILHSSFYTFIRSAYNYSKDWSVSPEQKTAYFYYLREYCYSSMFRYNSKGEFNVPYGGMSYNTKDFSKLIEYMKSGEMVTYLNTTSIYNLDFEKFINKLKLSENDFIFVDPPYDYEGSGFSEYDKNEFNRDDQTRLANLLKETPAKTMVVIKKTNFIYSLYKERGFYISSFDKKYNVNFQNRNNRDVEHLIITNYKLEEE